MTLVGATFHHIGIACRSITREEAALGLIGYRRAGPVFQDSIQGVEGVFLEGGGPRLELLVNLPGSSTLDPWLKCESRMYHLAYEVPDLDASVNSLQSSRAKLVSGPVPAVAFDGRRIAFVMLRTMSLVELIAAA